MHKKFIALLVSTLMAFNMCVLLSGCSIEDLEEYGEQLEEDFESQVEEEKDELESELDGFDDLTQLQEEEETTATTAEETEITEVTVVDIDEVTIDIDGVYTTRDDVALYIHTYECLPSNFMTKNEARQLGWEGGSLEPYAPGMCIGGDYFGNYEELLPVESGREYHECDINTLGASSRGAERLIYSNDGLIYYTADHYDSFTLLYGEE